jgi:hypothetical protein
MAVEMSICVQTIANFSALDFIFGITDCSSESLKFKASCK